MVKGLYDNILENKLDCDIYAPKKHEDILTPKFEDSLNYLKQQVEPISRWHPLLGDLFPRKSI